MFLGGEHIAEGKEDGSQGSYVPATNIEDQTSIPKGDKGEQPIEVGSTTRDIFIEACEQLSRERKQKEEKEHEREVISPESRKGRGTPKEKEATRTSIRQYQKRGGKACTRGETVAMAEIRKQTHLSPGTPISLLDFLSDDVLIYIANSCGVSLNGETGGIANKNIERWWSDRSRGRPVIGVQ